VLIIAALAIGPEAGFILLATRAMGTPVTLIGGAVGQIFLSRAPAEMRADRLPEFTTEVLRGLALVGVAPLVFIGVIAPSAFVLIFGEEWRRAGELVAWMTPWFVLKLLSSPISMVMHVKMFQRAMLGLMVAGLILRLAITLGAYFIDTRYITEGYALSGAVFYFVALAVYLHATGAGWRIARSFFTPGFVATVSAIAAGLAFNFLISTLEHP